MAKTITTLFIASFLMMLSSVSSPKWKKIGYDEWGQANYIDDRGITSKGRP